MRNLQVCESWREPRQLWGLAHDDRAAVGRSYVPLSLVERAHARSARRLLKGGK